MAIEWGVKIDGRRPTLGRVHEEIAKLANQLGVKVGEIQAFRQQLDQGKPIGPAMPVAADEQISVSNKRFWLSVDEGAIVGVGVVDASGDRTDEETGEWCFVGAGRWEGAKLFALLVAAAIAKTTGAMVRDDPELAHLGREFPAERLLERAPAVHGLGLVNAETAFFKDSRCES
ncbi:hypothetical protein COCOR_05470 [Corallococcus coralloides DSM 2259]|uniref:Uncharacterized protein n=1 Tax=Corallococcus coralloides (strain ATCC 25202 / DSM 2259 / NBRC 100086 / M2) TaxID=1144275 RepID=H8MZ34_CORCM|nr:hypothetical protein [Corallococcus coralloides]AFE06389.1 hypothetical protein COCOR_05470 [Corallococcus coralloides DSM 2259]